MSTHYRSQCGQDRFVSEYLLPHEGGTFFEAGAIDGEFLSNTFFFEKEKGWRGALVEMMPWYFPKIEETRPNSLCFNCALSEDVGYRLFLNAGDRSGLLKFLERDSVAALEEYYQAERPTFTVNWMQTR